MLLMTLAPASVAQSIPQNQYVNQYARTGRPTIDVFIWGEVGTPGLWRVEPDIDLIELLSVARVTGVGLEEPDISRRVSLRIYREEGGQRSEIYSQQLDHILTGGRAYPTLQDGDILEVVTRRRRRLGLQTVTQIVGTAASLTLLILRISDRRR